jgi:histidyl-tRNA synthetase
MTAGTASTPEAPIGPVRGTRDWLPDDLERLAAIEDSLLARFSTAGYRRLRTPILEPTELHERKSGAGIVSRLFELKDGAASGAGGLCLRPELTASVARAYTAAPSPPALPWRVSASGPVFRLEPDPRPGRLREFTQVGVEQIGGPAPEADAEVIALAFDSLRSLGVADPILRIGHAGLILEMLERSGLPPAAWTALVENLSEAAAEGRNVRVLESALERLSGWLEASEADAGEILPAVSATDEPGVDRLFRQLVPSVIGRRSGHEILGRLRRKWHLGHSLREALERARARVHSLADLAGPAPEVLARLRSDLSVHAPGSVTQLEGLVSLLSTRGIGPSRVVLDLGFGHGIGFYSQMIFELAVPSPDGSLSVCHGGRYDGLSRVLGSDRDPRGVGFAFGLERVYHALRGSGAT